MEEEDAGERAGGEGGEGGDVDYKKVHQIEAGLVQIVSDFVSSHNMSCTICIYLSPNSGADLVRTFQRAEPLYSPLIMDCFGWGGGADNKTCNISTEEVTPKS